MLRIHTLALGLALCAGAAGAAAAQGTQAPRDSTASRQHDFRGRGARAMPLARGLFRGIQPTSAQRTQIDSVRARYRPQMQSIVAEMRPAMKDARAARQRGDTAAARAAFARTEVERTKLQELRKQELADVRSVLTPEQRQRFDQNLTTLENRMREHRGRKRG